MAKLLAYQRRPDDRARVPGVDHVIVADLPRLPRITIRRCRSWLCHWLVVKSYKPDRPSPKSNVAKMVVASLACVSPVQPTRFSGSTRGACTSVAFTRTGPASSSAASRLRISAMA
jgi:hypothetical protein